MNSILTCLLLIISSLLTINSCDKKSLEDEVKLSEPMKIELQAAEASILKSNQAFAFDFFTKVLNEEDQNFMVSPFSLSMALAMTWNGSANDTKLAIQNTLGFEGWTNDEINGYFKKLKDAFEKTDSSTKLSIANSIWTNQNVKILPNFIALNQTYYNATVESVDFGNSATVGRINKWAGNNTNGLIENVIEETNPLDLMYLLNALYFKGIWVSEFNVKHTSKMDFTTENGNKAKVDMMQQKSNFNFAHNNIMQLVELPYGNKAFSMMVLLPKEDKTLMDVATALQQEDYWSNLKRKLSNKEVQLFIPKFKTEYSKKLNDVLIDMGMGIAFNSDKADFSRMSDKDAFISIVTQDTYIATDEVGTEAAAVTSSGAILFMGAVRGL